MKLPFFVILQQALIGFVLAAVVCGVWWLATGVVPGLGELLVTQFLLNWSLSLFLYARRTGEVQKLKEMYEQPSAEEEK